MYVKLVHRDLQADADKDVWLPRSKISFNKRLKKAILTTQCTYARSNVQM